MEFCCGICDITTRNRNDRTIDLPFDSSDDILVYVMAKINDCIRSVKGGFPDTRGVFCPIAGINGTAYNKGPFPDDKQLILNNSLVDLNTLINCLNQARGLYTPRLVNSLHKYMGRGTRHKHLYKKLSEGCHPTGSSLEYWAKAMFRVLTTHSEMGLHGTHAKHIPDSKSIRPRWCYRPAWADGKCGVMVFSRRGVWGEVLGAQGRGGATARLSGGRPILIAPPSTWHTSVN